MIGMGKGNLPSDYPLDPYRRPVAMFSPDGRIDLYRARIGEGFDGTCAADLVASCCDAGAALAAASLISGEAFYPLWRSRQPW